MPGPLGFFLFRIRLFPTIRTNNLTCLHAGVIRMEERLFQASAFLKDSEFLWGTGEGAAPEGRKWSAAAEIAHATAGEFAGRGVLIAHARLVVAGPAQTSGTIDLTLPAVTANHGISPRMWPRGGPVMIHWLLV